MKLLYTSGYKAMLFPAIEVANSGFDMKTAQETVRGRFKVNDQVLIFCDDNKWHPAKVLSVRGIKLKVKYLTDHITETVDAREVEIVHDKAKHGNTPANVKGLKEGDKIEFRLDGLKTQGIVAGFIERDKAVYDSVFVPAFGKNYPLNLKNGFKIIG